MPIPGGPTGTMFTFSGSIPDTTTLEQTDIPLRKVKPFTPVYASQYLWSGGGFLHRWWVDAEAIAVPDGTFAPTFFTAVWGKFFGVTAEWEAGLYYVYVPLVWELVTLADAPAYWYILLSRDVWGTPTPPDWFPFT